MKETKCIFLYLLCYCSSFNHTLTTHYWPSDPLDCVIWLCVSSPHMWSRRNVISFMQQKEWNTLLPDKLPSVLWKQSQSFTSKWVSCKWFAILLGSPWTEEPVLFQAASLLLQLRQKWHSLFLRRMRAPSKPWSQVDEATIRAIIAVLSTEEQSAGLQQPSGIGQRPRPMSSEELPLASSWRSNNSRKTSADTEFSDESAAAER